MNIIRELEKVFEECREIDNYIDPIDIAIETANYEHGWLHIEWSRPEIEPELEEMVGSARAELYHRWVNEIEKIRAKYKLTDQQLDEYLSQMWQD